MSCLIFFPALPVLPVLPALPALLDREGARNEMRFSWAWRDLWLLPPFVGRLEGKMTCLPSAWSPQYCNRESGLHSLTVHLGPLVFIILHDQPATYVVERGE